MLRRLSIPVLFLACVASAQIKHYTVIPGNLDSDGLPTSSAKLCVHTQGRNDCYTPPSKEYAFGLNARAIDLKEWDGLTIFTAEFSGGGSGTLTHIALFDLRRTGSLSNLLPDIALSNQSEFRTWNIPQVSEMPIVATADFVWEKGESHFARHRYTISTYLYDVNKYVRADQYVTGLKYPGLDDADKINVLESERPHILDRVKHSRKR